MNAISRRAALRAAGQRLRSLQGSLRQRQAATAQVRRLRFEPLEDRRLLAPLAESANWLDFETGSAPFDQAADMADLLVDFEDVGAALPSEGYWNGPDPEGIAQPGSFGDTVIAGGWTSGGARLNNIHSLTFGSWTGWAYSNTTDRLTPGFTNQYSAFPGTGEGGSATYAIAYYDHWETYAPPTLQLEDFAQGAFFRSVSITNTTYVALSMLHGDSFAKKFGGSGGDDADWFLLTIEGRKADGTSAGTIDFYLADYRFSNNVDDYLVDRWSTVDLTALRGATQLEFRLTSSDMSEWGMNTPAYFALDNLVVAEEEPVGHERLVVASASPGPSGFTVAFNRPVAWESLNLVDVSAGTIGPADVTLVGAATGPVQGSLVAAGGGLQAAFVRTGARLPPDTYTATLRSAANGFHDLGGELLDGDRDGLPGGDFAFAFTVDQAAPVTVGLPDFARGPGQVIDVRAVPTGLPLRVSDAAGITALDVQLGYDPQLLTIAAVRLGPDLPAGAAATLDASAPGGPRLRFSSPQPLVAGEAVLLYLQASVPAAAPYGAAQALTLRDLQAHGGALAATAEDAVQVVAFPGDATGDGAYSGLDAQRIARVVVQLDGGFEAYPRLDPSVLADVTGDGALSGLDAVLVAREVVGLNSGEIPPLPGAYDSPADLAAAEGEPDRESTGSADGAPPLDSRWLPLALPEAPAARADLGRGAGPGAPTGSSPPLRCWPQPALTQAPGMPVSPAGRTGDGQRRDLRSRDRVRVDTALERLLPRVVSRLGNAHEITSTFTVSPLTPALSPEYRGEGVISWALLGSDRLFAAALVEMVEMVGGR